MFFGTFKAKLGDFIAERVIGFVESLARNGIRFRQFFSHADNLRTLSGKKKRDGGCGIGGSSRHRFLKLDVPPFIRLYAAIKTDCSE
jgi:hypothetical protein